MNNELLKEKNPHGNAMFPLEVHEYETDVHLQQKLSCHWHEELEFLIVTKGSANFSIDSQTFRVTAGEAVFVNSNRLHSAVSDGGAPFAFFAIVFSPALLGSYGNDAIQQKYIDPVLNSLIRFPEHIRPCEEWEKRTYSLLTEIRELFSNKGTAYELQIKVRLYEIWYVLYSHSAFDEKPSDRNSDYRVTRIKAILEYIQLQYTRQITLTELAETFSMSEGQFCRFFKSMVKMSAVSYLNYYRINASAALLRNSDWEIGEIACSVGFNSISYFNKIFRRLMHLSPSEFRRSNPSLSERGIL